MSRRSKARNSADPNCPQDLFLTSTAANRPARHIQIDSSLVNAETEGGLFKCPEAVTNQDLASPLPTPITGGEANPRYVRNLPPVELDLMIASGCRHPDVGQTNQYKGVCRY